jgi:glycosyltransferase involved in cell wall biosynthesis
LLGLIANARALLFPSLAEGFGLPVVEAMALGTPVLTSDRGALAEIAGGAALTVDPTRVDAMAAALARLVSDDALVRALVDRGRVRAATFSTDRFVARLAAVYGNALRSRADGASAPHFRGHQVRGR